MKKVVIYSKKICPFCIRAKLLLDKFKVDYEEIDVSIESNMESLFEKTGWTSVPQIFIGDKFVGGCDDLYKLYNEGKLEQLLNE